MASGNIARVRRIRLHPEHWCACRCECQLGHPDVDATRESQQRVTPRPPKPRGERVPVPGFRIRAQVPHVPGVCFGEHFQRQCFIRHLLNLASSLRVLHVPGFYDPRQRAGHRVPLV
jgi:hypothetical protein